MSSFSNPHFMYLFALKCKPGKRRLAYGQSPEDALIALSYRCTPEEMEDSMRDDFQKIHQRELQPSVHLVG